MATSTAGADYSISQHSGSPAEASTESGRSPISSHTPFLQNLSQRFRRGSNVSSNTSDSQGQHVDKNEGSTVPAQNPKQQERARADAARAAKRYLMTIVRNDWEFSPDTPLQQQKNSHPDSREPVSWRLRDDGSEDELDHAHPTSPTKRRSKGDPYRFENPDAVADYMRERQIKRRKVLHEQMAWNEGLRNWALERDAWTGAVWKNPAGTGERKPTPNGSDAEDSLGIILRKGDIPDSGTNTTRTTSSPTPSDPDHKTPHLPTTGENPTPKVSASPTGTSIDSLEHTTTATAATFTDPTAPAATTENKPKTNPPQAQWLPPSPTAQGPYIPIYPPLFPEDNVLRSRIHPATYGTIYSKVVVQSLTPNIPIPLPDMVRSLVHGWKEEGQWPPSGNPGDGVVSVRSARNGGTTAGKMDGGAFARWRREKERKAREGAVAGAGERDGGAGRKGSVGALIAEGSGAGSEGGTARHGHRVRRSISSVVKRVIGKDDEARRESEVGLSLGFEEDDEVGDGFGGEGEADQRLNRALLEGGAG